MGLADPVPALARPAGDLGLHPAQAGRVAGLPADEGARQGEQGAAARELHQLGEPQDRAHGPVRRGGRAGGHLVHGAVLRALLPDRHAEGALEDRLPDRGGGAGAGHRALRLLRLALRQDRPQEDHDGRLPAGGDHLLPDLQGDDPLRKPGAGAASPRARRSRSRPATARCTSSRTRRRSTASATRCRTSSPSAASRSRPRRRRGRQAGHAHQRRHHRRLGRGQAGRGAQGARRSGDRRRPRRSTFRC